jgi:hypothetical protein
LALSKAVKRIFDPDRFLSLPNAVNCSSEQRQSRMKYLKDHSEALLKKINDGVRFIQRDIGIRFVRQH